MKANWLSRYNTYIQKDFCLEGQMSIIVNKSNASTYPSWQLKHAKRCPYNAILP